MKHNHGEAFALMWYVCQNKQGCPHTERIWNSRDGVTPFGGITCPSCGTSGLKGGLSHVMFSTDTYAPGHKLAPGQRFFRDGTKAEAIKIMERRAVAYALVGHDFPPDVLARIIAEINAGTSQEFLPGWPMVDRHPEREL